MLQRYALIGVVIICLCAGCSGGPTLVALSGKVTVDEKPLESGVISFLPDEEKGNKFKGTIIAKIESGTYTVTTDGKSGIPVGHYKLTINTEMPPMGAEKMPAGPKVKLAERFRVPHKDNLRYEVKEAGTNDFKVSVK